MGLYHPPFHSGAGFILLGGDTIAKQYDWDYFRHLYTTGGDDVTLEHLASRPNAPAIQTIKEHSRREDWPGQRRAQQDRVKTKTLELASTTDAEVSARHAKVARSLLSKGLQALQALDPTKLPASEIRQFIKDAAEIERKALGLEQVNVRHSGSIDMGGARDELAERLQRVVTAASELN